MLYFKDLNNNLIVVQDKELFSKSLLRITFEFVKIENTYRSLIAFDTIKSINNKKKIEEYEIMFSEEYQEMIKSIISDKDRLEESVKKFKASNISKSFEDTIKELEELIKQF